MPFDGAEQAHRKEDCADDYVEAMEARGHEEGRRIDAVCEAEGRVAVFKGLQRGKGRAQNDREEQPVDGPLLVATLDSLMRERDRPA